MPDIELGPVEGGSSNLEAYLATPSGTGPWPGVVAIHEVFGLDDHLRTQADRLAAAGYLTLGPNLFSDGGMRKCVIGTMRALGSGRGKPVTDIEAARQHLLGHENCTGKVGVIGFCMGGGFALVTAANGFDAAAPNYGQLPKDLKRTLQGSCPMVASYGAKDVTLRNAAGKLENALSELDIAHDVKEYPSAGHAFLNDSYFGPSPAHSVQRIMHLGPDPVAAPDAWNRIEAFFARYLAN